MARYRKTDGTIRKKFSTVSQVNALATISGGTIAVYEDANLTQFTTGATLTVDFDGVTGLHEVAIDLSNAEYEAGKQYVVVFTAGTCDSVSLVGRVIWEFFVEANAPDVTVDAIDDGLIDASTFTSAAIETIQENLATQISVDDVQTAVDAIQTSVDTLSTDLATVDGIVDAILLDTDEMQQDWTDGGRLDTILDSFVITFGSNINTSSAIYLQ